MIKGARKQMIVVRTGNSRYFDEAYFVLREDAQKERKKSTDMLNEANRILSEIVSDNVPPLKNHNRKWFFFCIGGLCGSVLTVIVTLFIV